MTRPLISPQSPGIVLRTALLLAVALVTAFFVFAQSRLQPSLRIHYVDVEGGAATLIVTPAGESILVDAGWPGFDGRDAARIQTAMKRADISVIDHFINTHYHTDHYGGVPELAARVEIRNFYDHGPIESLAEDRDFPRKYAAYRAAAKNRTTTLKPGDEIKLQRAPGTPAISLHVIASNREVIGVRNGRPNDACTGVQLKADDPSDNARSVAFILRYGNFDFFDAGDLTWNIEHLLACPSDRVGVVDLYQVTHHGLNSSNNTALLRTLKPTVAIMNNGPRKGGHPDAVRDLRALPSLQALYQVHRNVTTTPEENSPEEFIANLDEAGDAAHEIIVTVDAPARTFTVTNGRTSVSRNYAVK